MHISKKCSTFAPNLDTIIKMKENNIPIVDCPYGDYMIGDASGKLMNEYGRYPCKIKCGVYALLVRGTAHATINVTEYDFKANDYKGNEVNLADYKGKVVLIVNTATKCGFTPQYDALEALYAKYKDQGFTILDFPCNQFFAQAPGSSEDIHSACVLRFAIAFPQFEKIKVNGKDAHPLYRYLTSQTPNGKVKKIKWNFTKFLIGRDGEIIARYEPTDKPESFENAIVEALKK